VLQRNIEASVPGADGIDGLAAAGAQVADAFGSTFWLAAALIAVAFVPALLLPRRAR
jgi:hypothetical protein